MKVSIIIPVYNASSTLLSTLKSIENQSWRDIEVVAVDDCSKDNCVDILEAFRDEFEAEGDRSLSVIRHNHNQGVAAARNTALDAITGDVVCWVDADDWIEPTAIEKAVSLFEDNATDVVGWDWTLSSPTGSRYMRQPDCSSPEDGLKALMGGTLRWNLWLFIVRRELWADVRFMPGMNMGEDMMAMIRVFLNSKKFVQIHEAFYTYLQTDASISKTMTDRNLMQVCANLDKASEAILDSPYKHLAKPYLDLLKLNVKLPLLVSLDKNDYLRWFECYPEANEAIMLNTHLPLRTKVLQKMAAMKLWGGIRCYNKLVYGVLYKLLLCGR